MSGLLSNLPSKGLLLGKAGGKGGMRRTPSVPQYCATNDTAPPADQLISTDESNRLLAKFHALVKERESKSAKRAGEMVPGSVVRMSASTARDLTFFFTLTRAHVILPDVESVRRDGCFLCVLLSLLTAFSLCRIKRRGSKAVPRERTASLLSTGIMYLYSCNKESSRAESSRACASLWPYPALHAFSPVARKLPQ